MAQRAPNTIPIRRQGATNSNQPYQDPTMQSVSPGTSWQAASAATSDASTLESSNGPLTPPTRAEQMRQRYGELGRVPLHRRGTSQIYERLEDLLRENGYKDTRVFTPEQERREAEAEEAAKASRGLVDFLTNLFPMASGGTKEAADDASQAEEESTCSSPPSATPSDLTSSLNSLDDDRTPRASRHVPDDGRQSSRYTSPGPSISSRPSESSLMRAHLAHPKPSRARTYLRHMASAATLPPPRPQSTPLHTRSITSSRAPEKDASLYPAKDSDNHVQPPLPNTWLETVTRAVLSTGSGGQISGPQQQQEQSQQQLRSARSSLSQTSSFWRAQRRNGLTDQTNTHAPPPLLAMLERGRAGRSESEVTRARVVCRSAPGSRASSPRRKSSTRGRGRGERRRKEDDKHRLPSLARMQVEGDAWNGGRGVPNPELRMTSNEVKSMYLSGIANVRATSTYDEADSDDDDGGSSSDSDDDGRLDLAQMMMHPKRQQSIRSLRKHLHHDLAREGALTHPRGRGPSFAGSNYVKSPLSEEDDWGKDWTRSRWIQRPPGGYGGGEDDEDAASIAQAFGDNGSGSSGITQRTVRAKAYSNRTIRAHKS